MATPSSGPYRIGWYARAGYVDFFARLDARLKSRGMELESSFACDHSGEELHLRNTYHLSSVHVLSHHLKHYQFPGGSKYDELKCLTSSFSDRALIECVWGEMSETGAAEAEVQRRLFGHLEFWDRFLGEKGIRVLVAEIPSILSNCAAWLICRRRNIEYLAFRGLPALGDRMAITTSWDAHVEGLGTPRGQQAFASEEEVETLVRKRVADLRAEGIRPTRPVVVIRALDRPLNGVPRSPRAFVEMFRRVRREKEYYLNAGFLRRIRDRFEPIFKRPLLRWLRAFDPMPPQDSERFFLFPLHSQGEWSNYQCLGIRYYDPIAVVREVAACLPIGAKLYVREHPAFFGRRPLRFYLRLRQIDRVTVISPYADGGPLLRNCAAVVTLGSTMGFEAFLLGKPTIYLANPWYQSLPGMHAAETPQRLAKLMDREDSLQGPTDAEIENTLRNLYAVTFEGYMYPQDVMLDPGNVDRFAQVLAGRFRVKGGTPVTQPEAVH